MASNDFSESYNELERLISYSKHYDCQIDQIDREARFVMKELTGREKIEDLTIAENLQVRLNTLIQLAKQRRIEVQAREDLKIADFMEKISNMK